VGVTVGHVCTFVYIQERPGIFAFASDLLVLGLELVLGASPDLASLAVVLAALAARVALASARFFFMRSSRSFFLAAMSVVDAYIYV
jgi:hypothetical protein